MDKFSDLKPLHNKIMFQFLDKTGGNKGAFSERTRSGIIIPELQSTQKGERWGKIVAIGPDAEKTGLKIGDFILIEALMWMEGIKFNKEKLWMTNSTKVLAFTNDENSTVTW